MTKEYIPDDRINIFYVIDRVSSVLDIKDGKKAYKKLKEFQDELIHNIGVDAIIKNSNE